VAAQSRRRSVDGYSFLRQPARAVVRPITAVTLQLRLRTHTIHAKIIWVDVIAPRRLCR
jgi:hypothetical protein